MTGQEKRRRAAQLLGVGWRQALDLPDGAIETLWINRLKIVRILRHVRPRVVILPIGRRGHPEPRNCGCVGSMSLAFCRGWPRRLRAAGRSLFARRRLVWS